MTQHLTHIHSADWTRFDLSFLPQTNLCIASLAQRLPVLDASLAEDRIRRALETIWPMDPRNEPTMLHGDYWPGNTLWRDGQLAAVIDWEDACLGDPLADLAISRLDIAWIFGLVAMKAFTLRYSAMRTIDLVQLPIWDLSAALRFIRMAGSNLAEWAAFYVSYDRYDITEQTFRSAFEEFVARASAEV